jgi:hypothetical protein
MKLFLTIFAAIIAAAAVIFSGLYAKARVNQWENELAFCYAEGESMQMAWRSRTRQIEMTSDPIIKLELLTAHLAALKEDQKAREIDRRILTLLENKPFHIPLAADERKQLAAFKKSTSLAASPTPAL